MKNSLVIISLALYIVLNVSASPLKVHSHRKKDLVDKNAKKSYREIEYDVTLGKDQLSYFVKPEEMEDYEKQFATIRTLGEEISCKLRGNCRGVKRGGIIQLRRSPPKHMKASKKSMQLPNFMSDNENPQMRHNPNGLLSANEALNSPVAGMNPGKFTGDPRYSEQSNAAMYGQQPQLNIKMPSQLKESSETQHQPEMPGGGPSPEMGMGMGGGGPPIGGQMGGAAAEPGVPGGPGPFGSDPLADNAMLKMQNQANDAIIQNSIQSKLAFMDQANGPKPKEAFPSMKDPNEPDTDSQDAKMKFANMDGPTREKFAGMGDQEESESKFSEKSGMEVTSYNVHTLYYVSYD